MSLSRISEQLSKVRVGKAEVVDSAELTLEEYDLAAEAH